jgi:hypothetical protein
MTIHNVPTEWIRSRDKFAAEIHDHLKMFIANHFDYVKVDLAIKGGWKKGYSWAGKYRITVKPSCYGRNTGYTSAIRIGYIAEDIEAARKILDKAASRCETSSRKNRLVMYHREMLLDKRVSKRHNKLIRDKYPERWYENLDAIKYGEKLLFRLLARRGWELAIDGYTAPDGRTFDDLFTYKYL